MIEKQEKAGLHDGLLNLIFQEDYYGKCDTSKKASIKVYDGGVTAVTDFNLEIADKEFIILVGPLRLW